MPAEPIRRTFVDIAHGQMHCRLAGDRSGAMRSPLLMLHGGPGSSAGLAPLIRALAAQGLGVIAPDMMGNGLSDPPPVEPDIAFYVDCLLMLLDELGVARVDCYGHHVGAQIACALAIRAPDRIGRLVLDGVGLFPTAQRRDFLDHYAPPVRPNAAGDHLAILWRFLSSTTTRFPHYSEDDRDRIPGGAPLPPDVLTDQLADVVRNWRSYHLSYHAGFAEDVAASLALVRQPALVLAVASDPLANYAASAAAELGDAHSRAIDRMARAQTILDFIDAESS